MKTVRLNKTWRARKIGRSVYVFTKWMEENYWILGAGCLEDVARKITKRMVERLLAKSGEFSFTIRDGRLYGKRSFTYEGKRLAKSIKIGCQRFPLTKVKELLSLFP